MAYESATDDSHHLPRRPCAFKNSRNERIDNDCSSAMDDRVPMTRPSYSRRLNATHIPYKYSIAGQQSAGKPDPSRNIIPPRSGKLRDASISPEKPRDKSITPIETEILRKLLRAALGEEHPLVPSKTKASGRAFGQNTGLVLSERNPQSVDKSHKSVPSTNLQGREPSYQEHHSRNGRHHLPKGGLPNRPLLASFPLTGSDYERPLAIRIKARDGREAVVEWSDSPVMPKSFNLHDGVIDRPKQGTLHYNDKPDSQSRIMSMRFRGGGIVEQDRVATALSSPKLNCQPSESPTVAEYITYPTAPGNEVFGFQEIKAEDTRFTRKPSIPSKQSYRSSHSHRLSSMQLRSPEGQVQQATTSVRSPTRQARSASFLGHISQSSSMSKRSSAEVSACKMQASTGESHSSAVLRSGCRALPLSNDASSKSYSSPESQSINGQSGSHHSQNSSRKERLSSLDRAQYALDQVSSCPNQEAWAGEQVQADMSSAQTDRFNGNFSSRRETKNEHNPQTKSAEEDSILPRSLFRASPETSSFPGSLSTLLDLTQNGHPSMTYDVWKAIQDKGLAADCSTLVSKRSNRSMWHTPDAGYSTSTLEQFSDFNVDKQDDSVSRYSGISHRNYDWLEESIVTNIDAQENNSLINSSLHPAKYQSPTVHSVQSDQSLREMQFDNARQTGADLESVTSTGFPSQEQNEERSTSTSRELKFREPVKNGHCRNPYTCSTSRSSIRRSSDFDDSRIRSLHERFATEGPVRRKCKTPPSLSGQWPDSAFGPDNLAKYRSH